LPHPSELLIEQPTKFELVINLRAAKALADDFALDPNPRRPFDRM